MIYVDAIQTYPACALRTKSWCHMATDGDIEILHVFARRLGLKRAWFQEGRSHRFPHYDLTPNKRAQAIQLGAVPVEGKELIRRCYPDVWAICADKGVHE